MGLFNKVALIVAAIFALPILLVPASWPLALLIVVLWLIFSYGLREMWDLEKSRRMGERGRQDIVEVRKGNFDGLRDRD